MMNEQKIAVHNFQTNLHPGTGNQMHTVYNSQDWESNPGLIGAKWQNYTAALTCFPMDVNVG